MYFVYTLVFLKKAQLPYDIMAAVFFWGRGKMLLHGKSFVPGIKFAKYPVIVYKIICNNRLCTVVCTKRFAF